MKLRELAAGYTRSAELLDGRIRQLRLQLAMTRDVQERWLLAQRIRELSVMRTEMRQLAEHCAHYYERGYRRNVRYTI